MHIKFNLKSFLHHTFVYGLSSVLVRVLSFLLTPLYVRSFNPDDYGIIILLFSGASIINAFISFGMETSFFRFFFKAGTRARVFTNCLIVVAVLASAFLLLTHEFRETVIRLIQPRPLSDTELQDYRLFVSMFSFIIFLDALVIVPLANLRAKGSAYLYAFVKSSNILLFILINLIFILLIPSYLKHDLPFSEELQRFYRPHWVGYVFIANLCASVLSFLFILKEFREISLRLLNFQVIKKLIRYSFPIMLANLSFIVNENIDKIILAHLLPPQESAKQIGIYGACGKIAVFLNIAVQTFRLGAEPLFFKHSKDQDSPQLYASIMLYFTICISIIAMGITVNLPLLKYFIQGNEEVGRDLYWSGLRVVPFLLYSYVFLGIYMNLSTWYKLTGKTYYAVYISAPGALLTILLNFWLIPKLGYVGSAVTTLIVYFSMTLTSYALGQRHYYIPYRTWRMCLYILCSAAVSFLSYYVVDIHIITGNLVVLALGFSYFYVEFRLRKSKAEAH